MNNYVEFRNALLNFKHELSKITYDHKIIKSITFKEVSKNCNYSTDIELGIDRNFNESVNLFDIELKFEGVDE